MSIRNALMNVFSESPFQFVYEHMQCSVQAAHLLEGFFEAVLQLRWEDAVDIQKNISLKESDADRLQRHVSRRLHSKMFLPVSRYELLSLVKSQDSIANQSEDIAGYVLSRQIVFPKDMHDEMIKFVQSSIAVCDEADHIVARLDSVMKSGFKGPDISEVERMADEIHDLEHQNDLLQVVLRKKLRAHEVSLSPVDTMFIYKILERIGNIADSAHRIGEKFTLMLVSL